ncbi:MAG: hypothetical protein COA84_03265 [Robiginitomaculum sp.]|nr:MAG: hypothetical protein COA84_03265 [Robiginitomaculum sp.]
MEHTKPERLHALDTVRGAALLLGIFFHASFSFFPGDTFWIIMDTQRSTTLSVTAFILHIFRMAIFFILAGFFGRMQLRNLGVATFLKDRLKRLGVPLLIFWPIAMVAFTVLIIWAMVVSNGGTMPENPPPPPVMTLKTFPLTYLWFLYVLILFYGALAIFRGLFIAVDRKQRIGQLFDAVLLGLQKTHLLPILLTIPAAIALYYHKQWHPWFGIPTPENGFIPNTASLVIYGTAFGLGWALHRQAGLIQRFEKSWLIYLLLAIALSTYCLMQVGTTPYYTTSVQGMTKIAYISAYALAIWCWSFGFIGLAQKFLSGHSATRRYLADSSYWLYLVHLPLIMALQVWVSQWGFPALAKYFIILAIALPIMLVSYHYLVRYTFIGALLNGKRKKRGN